MGKIRLAKAIRRSRGEKKQSAMKSSGRAVKCPAARRKRELRGKQIESTCLKNANEKKKQGQGQNLKP